MPLKIKPPHKAYFRLVALVNMFTVPDNSLNLFKAAAKLKLIASVKSVMRLNTGSEVVAIVTVGYYSTCRLAKWIFIACFCMSSAALH